MSDIEIVDVMIEIPYRSNVKYEFDKDVNGVRVDRVMYSALSYPANYGFIPNTLVDDGDPIDALVISEHSFMPGCFIKARLIGVLLMEDEGGKDEKLIALPLAKIDPLFKDVHELEGMPKVIIDRIKHFFETYKMLEKDKWVKVEHFDNKQKAIQLLQKGYANFK